MEKVAETAFSYPAEVTSVGIKVAEPIGEARSTPEEPSWRSECSAAPTEAATVA